MGKTSKRKKAIKQYQAKAEEGYGKVPHTFVFNRGVIGSVSSRLMKDVRRIFEPFTARDLETQQNNTLKDFVTIAGPLGVNYFVVFSKSDKGNNLKVMRLSRGPTMTFKIKEFVLAKDIAISLKKQSMYAGQFKLPPLLVLNNFNGEGLHLKLMATMFQNMFPPIDINTVKINNIRRCVLVNYNADTKLIDWRHYSISAVPVGMSRSVKKLIQTKVPSLQNYQDVADYFLNTGYLSESEAELDGDHNEVELPQRLSSRGNIAKQKSAVRLVEIGPRITLELVKIEEGLCDGEVLYHGYITKTNKEITRLRDRKLRKRKIRSKRKATQEENVKQKQVKKEEHKTKSLIGIAKKKEEEQGKAEEVEDDDVEYYRQEVGEEPDPDLFSKRSNVGGFKRKMDRPMQGGTAKRMRTGKESRDGGKKFDMTFSKGSQGKSKVFRKSSALMARDKKSAATTMKGRGKHSQEKTRQKGSFRKR